VSNEQIGARIRERLLARGYRREDDGEPDVQRFCWDHRFDKTLVYAWLRGTTPFKDLIRLCEALECSAEWLLTGKERALGKSAPALSRPPTKLKSLLLAFSLGAGLLWPSSGSAQAGSLSGADSSPTPRIMSRWGSRWRFRNNPGHIHPGMAYA